MFQAWSFNQDSWRENPGKEVEEEEADHDEEVGGEEGAPQVSEVKFRSWDHRERCAQSTQEGNKQKDGKIIPIMVIDSRCFEKTAEGNDGIGDEKDGGRDGGVVLQEGGDQ